MPRSEGTKRKGYMMKENDWQKQNQYDDMIDLPHPTSARHRRMSVLDRAAQFSPFAALTGYEAAVQETARLTEDWREPDESVLEQLDEQLKLLREHLAERPVVHITYFLPDEKKTGGRYVSVTGQVRKLDEYEHQIIFTDGTRIPVSEIVEMESEKWKTGDRVK